MSMGHPVDHQQERCQGEASVAGVEDWVLG